MADGYYSVCLALDLLGGSLLECSVTAATVSACLALDLLGGPLLVCGCMTATTVSAWLWISSVDLWWVADCCYSVCLALDLLS